MMERERERERKYRRGQVEIWRSGGTK